MTAREKLLLNLLGATVLGAGLLWGGQAWLDELSRLDSRFASVQKEAAQIQLKLVAASPSGPETSASLVGRFWNKGALPETLALARMIKPVFDSSGVTVKEFQVISATAEEFTLKYSLESRMDSFLKAFVVLKASDPHLIVRRFSCTWKERGRYALEWEVGYAVLP